MLIQLLASSSAHLQQICETETAGYKLLRYKWWQQPLLTCIDSAQYDSILSSKFGVCVAHTYTTTRSMLLRKHGVLKSSCLRASTARSRCAPAPPTLSGLHPGCQNHLRQQQQQQRRRPSDKGKGTIRGHQLPPLCLDSTQDAKITCGSSSSSSSGGGDRQTKAKAQFACTSSPHSVWTPPRMPKSPAAAAAATAAVRSQQQHS
jgi:hypothetical protein